MHDDWLIAISLCVSAAGIVILLFCLMLLPPDTSDPASSIKGEVISSSKDGNKTIAKVLVPVEYTVIADRQMELDGCILASGSIQGETVFADRVSRC